MKKNTRTTKMNLRFMNDAPVPMYCSTETLVTMIERDYQDYETFMFDANGDDKPLGATVAVGDELTVSHPDSHDYTTFYYAPRGWINTAKYAKWHADHAEREERARNARVAKRAVAAENSAAATIFKLAAIAHTHAPQEHDSHKQGSHKQGSRELDSSADASAPDAKVA